VAAASRRACVLAVIDFVIKSHKYKNHAELSKARAGGALAAARPDGDSLAQVLMDTKAFNQTEDEKQLDGAHKQLASRGHMLRPILLTQKLSMVDEDDERAAAPQHGGAYPPPPLHADSGQRAPPPSYGERPPARRYQPQARTRPSADQVQQWLHDRFDADSRSRSRSNSCGRRDSRSRSRSHSRGRRERRSRSHSWDAGRRPPPPGSWAEEEAKGEGGEGEGVWERPSPTYSPLRD
jgi:hypothetical protein